MKSKANEIISRRLRSPDYKGLQKIKKVHWTAHNIPLTETESTLGSSKNLVGEEPRTQIIKNNLYLFTGRSSLSALRLVDLGCLEGGLSFEMAREDIKVVGIEGSEANYHKCQLLHEYFDLPNLNFLYLDVKALNRESHGVFDIVLCCGLLYHLDDPVAFLKLLYTITHDESILILDTHFAPQESGLKNCTFKDSLSDMRTLEHNGVSYEGRLYYEYNDDADGDNHPWASVSNSTSFWLTKESLIRALYHAGFKTIYELHGIFEIEAEINLKKEYSRLGCIALRKDFAHLRQVIDSGDARGMCEKEIDELRKNLEAIEKSLFWKVATRFYRLRDRLLPNDSPRRKLYNKAMDFLRRSDP